TEAPAMTEAPAPALTGDAVRGAQLYDKWWQVLGVDTPADTHVLYPADGQKSGDTTWRCKECHGWDYKGADGAYGSGSHYTGIKGVFDMAGQPLEDIVVWLDGTENPDHNFVQYFNDDAAAADLAAFISAGLVDDAQAIDYETKAAKGDAVRGQELFGSICQLCHGLTGQAINFGGDDEPEYIGTIAADNPWELMHKIRAGQPTEDMPATLDAASLTGSWTIQDIADVIAYTQTLPVEKPAGDVARGGQLYDKWWKVLDVDAPTDTHVLYPADGQKSGDATWRCKECHGWDYKGVDGAYGSGSHFTGITGVIEMAGQPVENTVAWLDGTNNPDHNFAQYFDETAMADMAAFLSSGLLDDSVFIDYETKASKGEADEGEELYNSICFACHGQDGLAINFADEDAPEFVGTIANDNPWEFMHKVHFGQPGSNPPMPSAVGNGWDPDEIAAVLAYAQTLPVSK
ncbi:MAG: c-type cytochrome, partial [Chloroflexi bacterium]|nr:c-type cytochrome [Chloroflexota bacterium]